MNFVTRYFQKRRERRRQIAEAQAELFWHKCERMTRAFMKGVEVIQSDRISGFPAVIAEGRNKTDEEKTVELRLKYLKGEIKQ